MVGQPSLVPKVLPLVLNSIAVPQLAGSASVALKELARDCQEHLTPYAPQILDAVQVTCLPFNLWKSRLDLFFSFISLVIAFS